VLAEASASNYTETAEYIRMGIKQLVIQLALTDSIVMDCIFMSCCRNLAAKQASGPYLEHGLQYKASSIRAVRSAISDKTRPPGPAATTVALALATDSVRTFFPLKSSLQYTNNKYFAINDMPAARSHCTAVGIMIHLNGGPGASEGNAFIAQVVDWIIPELDRRKEDSPLTARFKCSERPRHENSGI
jgi:hypothetical protein